MPISRRLFLAAGAAAVVGACTDAFTAGAPAWALADVADHDVIGDALATLRSLQP